jgi:pimeloyl-ACP methyl ester carboxylesterase
MSALARQMPPVATAQVNGIDMAYYEVARGQGVPIVFCHGFPELAFSWRHQLRACEAAGQWAIAPDQRGSGLTSRPDKIEDYDMEHLAADLVALLDHLGIEKAVFCGHDWGGFVVWQMACQMAIELVAVLRRTLANEVLVEVGVGVHREISGQCSVKQNLLRRHHQRQTQQ